MSTDLSAKMRTCPKCKKKLVAADGYCAGWCREIVLQPLSVKRGTDSQDAGRNGELRDAIVTFDARGNRWNILKAICNPKSSIIKLVLPKSTIVISAKPQPNL